MQTQNKTTKAEALNITFSKDVIKNMKKLNYYDDDRFINDAYDYIKAIRDGRMINVIKSVSQSGMSRVIKFTSCEPTKEGKYYFRNYNCFFISLGYRESRSKDGFSISGCGMDMIFHTNYSICHDLKNMGFITKEECEVYCQMTPNTI